MDKFCSHCNTFKPIDEFNKDRGKKDGHHAICKICQRKDATLWYQNNRERHRKTDDLWRIENKDKVRASNRKYFQTEQGKATAIKGQKTYKENYPEKRRAQALIQSRIHHGKLQPAKTFLCSQCGNRQAEHYHHPDYSKPLDVVPVCHICHTAIHKK